MTVTMLIAKKVDLHQAWDPLDLGHLLLILLEQYGLSLRGGCQGDLVWGKRHRAEVVLLESCRKGWVLRDSQSSWRTESQLVNHKTGSAVARRTRSVGKTQTVSTT